MFGREGFNQQLRKAYDDLQVAWLTPSEIFRPHYGAALAECILSYHLRHSDSNEPLEIFEIGAGTGTVALDILDHLRESNHEIYASARYTSVEISEELADRQRSKVEVFGGHAGKFKVQVGDATSKETWKKSESLCYVVALEVLDNLPHDRVVKRPDEWCETHVLQEAEHQPPREVLKPVKDPTISRCLEALELDSKIQGSLLGRLVPWLESEQPVFLPTSCLELLEALHDRRPRHCLIAADFDALPDVVIPGKSAPLVSTTRGGRAVDHPTYLVPRGSADVFFPTDFDDLCALYGAAAAAARTTASAEVLSTHDFMRRHARWQETTTLGGFNPLLEEFPNTKIMIASACPA
eukprot:CAMPEP_0177611364 /NCGR_PEP_ID=MMETSP0419_2-20121207/20447_1 /TAXON_ID=582737 /ORGANISM="Tetraselmis sp., Strain GSL018" /LENGTH=351 /DNA_ID=CAMNT_0019107079 /DNA_START=334 /DNA_END=1389 /DNA_ORIENTATION=+